MAGPVQYGVCSTCGYLIFPVTVLQPCGHEGTPELRELDAEGVVYSWSRSWTGRETSVLIAMADFLDGGLRITAPVIGTESVAIGELLRAKSAGEGRFELRPTS